MEQEKIGKFIAECRKKQNLTQVQLGEKVGVTDKAVSKWESGLRLPDIAILNDLSNVLNITTTELLNGKKFQQNIQNIPITESQYYKIINKELLLFLNDHYNNCSIYLIQSKNRNYLIEGLIINSKDTDFININFIQNNFNDDMKNDLVYSYEYSFSIENDMIYKTGNILLYEYHKEDLATPFNKILQEIKIYIIRNNNKNNNNNNSNNASNKNLILQIKYINQDFEQKDIKIFLSLDKIFANNKVII